jgi:SAM-dependent methyltransferase
MSQHLEGAMMDGAVMTKLYPEFFRREDELPDELFYKQPRLQVHHIDEGARNHVIKLYSDLLPKQGAILDFMAGWDSHLPQRFTQVTGLGLNALELEANASLSERVVFDINRAATLPFCNGQFDGAVCTVSVQYMTRPDETFSEIARSLKPGAPFIVTFSNRMFPTKAVLAWRSSNDAAHIRLVTSYFQQVAEFGAVMVRSFVSRQGDPLYAVWAYRRETVVASLN